MLRSFNGRIWCTTKCRVGLLGIPWWMRLKQHNQTRLDFEAAWKRWPWGSFSLLGCGALSFFFCLFCLGVGPLYYSFSHVAPMSLRVTVRLASSPGSSRAAIVASMGRVDTWEGVFCVHLVRRLWSRFIIPFPKCPRISSIWDFAVTPLPPDSPVESGWWQVLVTLLLVGLWDSGSRVSCLCTANAMFRWSIPFSAAVWPKCVIFSTNYRLTYPSYVAPHPG